MAGKTQRDKFTQCYHQMEVRLETVEPEKDLGVITDSALSFVEHISNKISIANKNLGLILKTFTFMGKDLFLYLFLSLVRSHLKYASSVWSQQHKWILLQLKMSNKEQLECYNALQVKHTQKD